MSKSAKSQKLELITLSKKQLQTPTEMQNNGTIMVIRDLDTAQLRVALYRALKLQKALDQGIQRALNTLETIAP